MQRIYFNYARYAKIMKQENDSSTFSHKVVTKLQVNYPAYKKVALPLFFMQS